MTFDATKVSVAVTGAITKISDTETITSAEQVLSAAGNITYGAIGDGGVTIATDVSTSNIVAWQNSAVVRVAAKEATGTYSFVLLQNTKESRELYYSASEIGGKILFKPSRMTAGRFVVDYIDTNYEGEGGILYGRHVINRGQVTGRGDIVLANGEPVGYEITITAFPDKDGVIAEIFHGVASLEEPAA